MSYLGTPINQGNHTLYGIRRSQFFLQGVLVHAALSKPVRNTGFISLASTHVYEAPQPGLICHAVVVTMRRMLYSHPRTGIKDPRT